MELTVRGLGKLKGIEKDGVATFRGVAYAEPTSGDHRYAEPVATKPWSGVRDATHDGSVSPQVVARTSWALGDGHEGIGSIGEDCLNLTIWAPTGATDAPVFFWIHGGAFTYEAGSWAFYDGERLAREQGVVVVTCNYRLGALGYLFCSDALPRNLGLRDQIAALRWVNRHIASFGGDPAKVTIAGQSAGAHSVVALLQVEETKGLFNQAIVESYPGGIVVRSDKVAVHSSDAFLAALNLTPGDPGVMDRLRALSVEDVLNAQDQATKTLHFPVGDIDPPFAPVDMPDMPAGAKFLPSAAKEAAARGIRIFMGWARDESLLFTLKDPAVQAMTEKGVRDYAQRHYGKRADQQIARAKERRPGAGPVELFNVLMSDVVFRDGTLEFARQLTADGATVHVYRFDWRPPSPLKACHCIELPFVFGNLPAWEGSAMMGDAKPAALEPLVQDVQGRWGAFIKGGDPGVPAWTADQRPVLHIDLPSRIELLDDADLI